MSVFVEHFVRFPYVSLVFFVGFSNFHWFLKGF